MMDGRRSYMNTPAASRNVATSSANPRMVSTNATVFMLVPPCLIIVGSWGELQES